MCVTSQSSFLRNDIMSDSEFTAIPVRPCIKCGSTDRRPNGGCRPCKNIAQAKWKKINAESQKTYTANRYKLNPEKQKAAINAWRAANPEKVKADARAYNAVWSKAHPEAAIIYAQNRRARKLESGGELSKGLAKKLLILQKGKCACCGKPLSLGYHLDHIMPLARGGSNSDDNMQLLTAACNLQKHAKHPIDFMQSRGFLL